MATDAADIEARFFALSIDMLCIAHFNGHFSRLSLAWETTLGFTREELRSRPMFEFVHPDDRERTIEQNRKVKAGGQAVGFENRYICKDGSYRWLLWNASADVENQLIYSVARDITRRKEAEQQREQLVGELQAALADVKQLQAILPICMYCKKIRDDRNYWQAVEVYISNHTGTLFSHGICPSCLVAHREDE
jgi:PAS domain S-box-containing protein